MLYIQSCFYTNINIGRFFLKQIVEKSDFFSFIEMSPPPLWKCLDIAICHGFYIEKYSNFGLLHSYCLTFKRGRGEGYIFFSLEPYIFFMQYLKSIIFFVGHEQSVIFLQIYQNFSLKNYRVILRKLENQNPW